MPVSLVLILWSFAVIYQNCIKLKKTIGGEFPLIQGYYLRSLKEIKIEEFSFAGAGKGENNIEIDLRLEKDGQGQNATVGVKVRITKVN